MNTPGFGFAFRGWNSIAEAEATLGRKLSDEELDSSIGLIRCYDCGERYPRSDPNCPKCELNTSISEGHLA